ncbi:hypothetical protein [Streptomyces sp. CFMR 7]|uniref:hypothetical protein n=1 Tax=Streptomyces sp. CFMR 7 TaxID=1649184 RepID=UPI00119E6AB7|nr:hypothetical protein [Streptomyces sp. CFMR 7]
MLDTVDRPGLPDNLTLQKLLMQKLTPDEIAKRYGVTRAAVTYRMRHHLKTYTYTTKSPVLSQMPWDLADLPNRAELMVVGSFRGLRRLVAHRLDGQAPDLYMRAFLNRVARGEVLALVDGEWAYVPRSEEDGDLVVRWPDGAPAPTEIQKQLFARPAD